MLVDKYQLPLEEENGKVYIDFKQFMEIMTENIIRNRERFGTQSTIYESGKIIIIKFFFRNFNCYLYNLSI